MSREDFKFPTGPDAVGGGGSPYRDMWGQSGQAGGRTGGLSKLWAGEAGSKDGHSSQDWREEWKRQRKEPIPQSRDWKKLWLGLGLVVVFCFSIFAIYMLDGFLEKQHWHWMNPNDTVIDSGEGGAGGPSIHWGGR